jgi:hypothetical protein
MKLRIVTSCVLRSFLVGHRHRDPDRLTVEQPAKLVQRGH